ncbi:MAG TPA: hypothetical protein VHF25_06445 [Nitriliruptorales bacterium]|nr:hypothetical protein [Nitriliruptorales bacterium]
MSQHSVEVILAKQLASHLTLPIFLVDPIGNLLYYNEPAEQLLGHRFEATGEMPVDDWATTFQPTDRDGRPLPASDLPLVVAVDKRVPAHRTMTIRGLDGVVRDIEVMAFPLEGEGARFLGAVAIFWETGPR